jgi:hypothetical protein
MGPYVSGLSCRPSAVMSHRCGGVSPLLKAGTKVNISICCLFAFPHSPIDQDFLACVFVSLPRVLPSKRGRRGDLLRGYPCRAVYAVEGRAPCVFRRCFGYRFPLGPQPRPSTWERTGRGGQDLVVGWPTPLTTLLPGRRGCRAAS